MSLFSKVSGPAIAVAALVAFAPGAVAQPAPEPEVITPDVGSHITVIGAIKDRNEAATPAAPEDTRVPELPVVYEDD